METDNLVEKIIYSKKKIKQDINLYRISTYDTQKFKIGY